MNVHRIETVEQSVAQLARESLRYASTGKEADVHERYAVADALYDFLTQSAPDGSANTSFVKAFGTRKLFWEYGPYNIGPENRPLLWGLEGVGDHRGVNFMLWIPVELCYMLDRMSHRETSEPITDYHKNLLEVFGDGTSGTWATVDYGGTDMRFVSRILTKEKFKKFMSFGSDYRLQRMARQIDQEVTSK